MITSSEINIEDVDEVGKTFRENSILKAKSIPDNYISISDDSGLCIDSLGGFPGIFQLGLQRIVVGGIKQWMSFTKKY